MNIENVMLLENGKIGQIVDRIAELEALLAAKDAELASVHKKWANSAMREADSETYRQWAEVEIANLRDDVKRLNAELAEAREALVLCSEKWKQAETRAAANEKDAQRYRWLRERVDSVDFAYGSPPRYVLMVAMPDDMRISANLDASIDAAMGGRDE